MKIGDRIFVHGYIDEIRKDTVIIRNNGGYFGTIPSEVITGEVPSAQSEHWISCSERLPEVGTYVLVSKKPLGFRSNLPNVCTAHRSRDPRSGKEEWIDMLFGKLDDDDVLAWMPLPESYKE